MNESDNVWRYKPWWCQPWSIILTGCTLIAGVWWLTRLLWLTILVALPVLVWMGFFVVLWPALMRDSGLLQELKAEKAYPPMPNIDSRKDSP